jgi:hypothetical protein
MRFILAGWLVNVIYKVGAICTDRMVTTPGFALKTREEPQHTSGRRTRDRVKFELWVIPEYGSNALGLNLLALYHNTYLVRDSESYVKRMWNVQCPEGWFPDSEVNNVQAGHKGSVGWWWVGQISETFRVTLRDNRTSQLVHRHSQSAVLYIRLPQQMISSSRLEHGEDRNFVLSHITRHVSRGSYGVCL